jgi:hypothetical protein
MNTTAAEFGDVVSTMAPYSRQVQHEEGKSCTVTTTHARRETLKGIHSQGLTLMTWMLIGHYVANKSNQAGLIQL